jgi:hypothetical protein
MFRLIRCEGYIPSARSHVRALGAELRVCTLSQIPYEKFPIQRRYPGACSWVLHFLTNPVLDIVIAPENRIRVDGSFQMVYYRDIHDLLFDCTLWYRFFTEEHQMGDFAGLGVGMNLPAASGGVSYKRCIIYEVRSARKLLTVGSTTILCWCYHSNRPKAPPRKRVPGY